MNYDEIWKEHIKELNTPNSYTELKQLLGGFTK